MQEFKGTPGKWTISYRSERDVQANGDIPAFHVKTADIYDENRNSIATVHGYDTDYAKFAPSTKVDANAALIAAAPDMLNALEVLVQAIRTKNTKYNVERFTKLAESAINKALGLQLTETI